MGPLRTTNHKQYSCTHVLLTFGLALKSGLNIQGGGSKNKAAFESTALYDIMTGRSSTFLTSIRCDG